MTKLEYVYLLNVMLYFKHIEDVKTFIQINHICLDVVQSLKTNPSIENVLPQQIQQLFSSIETFNVNDKYVYYISRLHDIKFFTFHSRHLPITYYKEFTSKVTKLSLPPININDIHDIYYPLLKTLHICIRVGWNHSLNIFQHFPSLQQLIIHLDSQVRINYFKEFIDKLTNVKVTIIIPKYVPINVDYINDLEKCTNTTIYYQKITTSTISKNILDSHLRCNIDAYIQFPDIFMKILNSCYPISLTLLDTNASTDKSKTFKLDLSHLNLINELVYEQKLNEQIYLIYPSYLSKLTLSNANEANIKTLSTLHLIQFKLEYTNFKTIPLPSTLQKLIVRSCSNCRINVSEDNHIESLNVMNCTSCNIGVGKCLKEFELSNNQSLILIGVEDPFKQFFEINGIEILQVNVDWVQIIRKQLDCFVHKSIDLRMFKQQYIYIRNMTCKQVFLNTPRSFELMNCRINSLCFDSINTFNCNRSKIFEISANCINNLETSFDITNKSQVKLDIKNIKNVIAKCVLTDHLKCKELTFRNIRVKQLDATPIQTEILKLEGVSCDTLTLPPSIRKYYNISHNVKQLIGIETTQLTNKRKCWLLGRWSKGIFQCCKMNTFIVKKSSYPHLDLSLITCSKIQLLYCHVSSLVLPSMVKTLYVNGCNFLSSLNLSGYSFRHVSFINCQEIRQVYVEKDVVVNVVNCPKIVIERNN